MTSFIQAFTDNSSTPLMTWQHLLTAALRIPPPSNTASSNAAHPLPALLFLIDAIAILRALKNGSLTGHFVDGELDVMEMLDHFLSYLGELYSHDGESTTSPFALTHHDGFPTIGALANIAAEDAVLSDKSLDQARTCLQQCATEALDWLHNYRTSAIPADSRDVPLPTSTTLSLVEVAQMQHNLPLAEDKAPQHGRITIDDLVKSPRCTIPAVDPSLQATLVQALEAARERHLEQAQNVSDAKQLDRSASAASMTRRRSHSRSGTSLHRWTLASLLKHYLGSDFGQQVADNGYSNGRASSMSTATHKRSVRYAVNDADDEAVRIYFPRPNSSDTRSLHEYSRAASPFGFPSAQSPDVPRQETVFHLHTPDASTESIDLEIRLPTSPEVALQPKATRDARSDVKLRWLFGEPVSSMPSSRHGKFASMSSAILGPSRQTTYSNPAMPNSDLLSRRDVATGVQMLNVRTGMTHPSSTSGTGVVSPHRRAFSADSLTPIMSASPDRSVFTSGVLDLHIRSRDDVNDGSRPSIDDQSFTSPSIQTTSGILTSSTHSRTDSLMTIDSHTRLLGRSGSNASTYASPTAYRNTMHGIPRLAAIADDKDTTELLLPHRASFDIQTASPNTVSRLLPDLKTKAFGDLLPIRGNRSPEQRSSALFARRDSDRSSASETATIGRDKNELTTEQKATLVKKNRKLRAVLGASYLDDADQKILHRALKPHAKQVQASDEDDEFYDANERPSLDGEDDEEPSLTLARPVLMTSGDSTDLTISPDMPLHEVHTPTTPMPNDTDATRKQDLAHIAALHAYSLASQPPISEAVADQMSPMSASRADRPSAEALARAARRRKLLKVQSFLGERVPASAVGLGNVPLSPRRTSQTAAIAALDAGPPQLKRRATARVLSKASSRLNKLTRGKGTSGAQTDGSFSEDASETIYQDSAIVIVDPAAVRSQQLALRRRTIHEMPVSPIAESFAGYKVPPRGGESSGMSSGISASSEPAIAAIRRARKLEKMFGSLPPTQLYARKPAAFQSARLQPKLQAREERPMYRASSRRRGSRPDIYKRWSMSDTSSLYRYSIASVRYVAESEDPLVFDAFKRVVMADNDEVDAVDDQSEGGRTPRRRPSRQQVPIVAGMRRKSVVSLKSQKAKLEAQDDKSATEASAHGDVSSSDDNDVDEEVRELDNAIVSRGEVVSRAKTPPLHSLTDTENAGDMSSSSNDGMGIARRSARASLVFPFSPGDRSDSKAHQQQYIRGVRDSARTAYVVSPTDSAYTPLSPEGVLSSPSTPLAPGGGQQMRGSMESVRLHVKRAHKLARVLGTTKSEILNSVLDVIEADIAELDEEDENGEGAGGSGSEEDHEDGRKMDAQERKELLDGVAALRAEL